jgi:hypothetical protein
MKFNGASMGFDEYVNGISMGFQWICQWDLMRIPLEFHRKLNEKVMRHYFERIFPFPTYGDDLEIMRIYIIPSSKNELHILCIVGTKLVMFNIGGMEI